MMKKVSISLLSIMNNASNESIILTGQHMNNANEEERINFRGQHNE